MEMLLNAYYNIKNARITNNKKKFNFKLYNKAEHFFHPLHALYTVAASITSTLHRYNLTVSFCVNGLLTKLFLVQAILPHLFHAQTLFWVQFLFHNCF